MVLWLCGVVCLLFEVDIWSIAGDKKIRAGAGGIRYLFVIIVEVYAKCHGQRL